ncbi:alpha/beta fold hydrolase [Hyunsoonleella sp. 2307UL5-6]|uniref:alpha/beta fold hydrolase n=1 Tax=Hyunsoonleella sp. 2307UL5-6 TaxID=3384768 RepID=UPI0039BD7F63
MKNICILILLTISVLSCKPYQSKVVNNAQMTYSEFRATQQSFNSKDGNISYIDKGKGPVILLLHGVPTSGWLYRNMIDELAKTNRVIVPDMLGFGSSDSPDGYNIYSEENHAKRLLALMDFLDIEDWTHVMHDAGGLWTWELAAIAPNRIKNMVMLNTIVYEEGFDPPIRFKKGFFAKTAMWSYRNGITTNMMLKGLFKSGMTENTLTKIDVEGYKTPLKEGKTKAMYYFFTQTCNALKNYQPIIEKLNIPVTIIWGKNDDFLKWSPQKERITKDLNISEDCINIIEAKHFIQEEQPEVLTRIILDFIKT